VLFRGTFNRILEISETCFVDNCTVKDWENYLDSVGVSLSCTPPLLVSIKGGGRHLHARRLPSVHSHPTHRALAHSPDIGTCLNHLAETWKLPSLSRLACTPLLQALRCKIIQCTRTSLLDVRPRGRNQNKPLRYCVTSYINHLGLGTRSIITSWCQAARSGHRQNGKEEIKKL